MVVWLLDMVRHLSSVTDLPTTQGTSVGEAIHIDKIVCHDMLLLLFVEQLVHGPESLKAFLATEKRRVEFELDAGGTLQFGCFIALWVLTDSCRGFSTFHNILIR